MVPKTCVELWMCKISSVVEWTVGRGGSWKGWEGGWGGGCEGGCERGV